MIEYKVKVYENRTVWFFNGKLHRENDLPAVEYINGHKEWYLNDERHREDGAAIEWDDGNKSWWLNGERHRKDGAAVEYADGDKEWWLNGKEYSEEAFNLKTSKAKELTVKQITELLGYDVKIVK